MRTSNKENIIKALGNENNHKGSFCLLIVVATGRIGQGLSERMLEPDETYTERVWLMIRLRNRGWVLE